MQVNNSGRAPSIGTDRPGRSHNSRDVAWRRILSAKQLRPVERQAQTLSEGVLTYVNDLQAPQASPTPTKLIEVIVMRPKVIWVLVADGARGRILERKDATSSLLPMPGGEFHQEIHQARELGTDRPGRVQESASAAHHAISPRTDRSRVEKETFARKLSDALEAAAQRGAFDKLILIAPPRTLGDLHASLGRRSRERLAGTLEKDLTALNPTEIEARLKQAELL